MAIGDKIATREAYGDALVEFGAKYDIVVFDADLAEATKTLKFKKAYPDRFFDVGIAEGNMVAVAASMATTGRIPFASSFASFLCDKGYDQLRMAVAYPGVNAKFCGSHGGISIGEDGPSQMAIEDFALMCALPGFVVVVPSLTESVSGLHVEALYEQATYFANLHAMSSGQTPPPPHTHTHTTRNHAYAYSVKACNMPHTAHLCYRWIV
jgi:transketolase C-terminal domain/subunit